MKKIIYLLLLIVFCSCSQTSEDKKLSTKENRQENYYYDKEANLYVLTRNTEATTVDTVWYYKDSMKKELVLLNTFIYKNGIQKINQVIRYDKDSNIDTSRSYKYKIERINQELNFNIISMFNDSIYLIIGDLDENYKLKGKADTFAIDGGNITIPIKKYYSRARIGILEKTDSNTYIGKELYVPEKMIELNSSKK